MEQVKGVDKVIVGVACDIPSFTTKVGGRADDAEALQLLPPLLRVRVIPLAAVPFSLQLIVAAI